MPRIAFYAPLKSPEHPVASGDRQIARLTQRALTAAGFTVDLVSSLRSFCASGGEPAQRRLSEQGEADAARLLKAIEQGLCPRPQLWFTYHVYHKAPDDIGPRVARALGIPYVIMEASYSAKQQVGPWQWGLRQSVAAFRQAALIFVNNPKDRPGLVSLDLSASLVDMPAFIDAALFAGTRHDQREQLAVAYQVDPTLTWFGTLAMLRPGDKAASYAWLVRQLLALSAQRQDWHWWVIGDGKARALIEQQAAPLAGRVRFLGALSQPECASWLRQWDWQLWPAINEALGLSLLESQAAGTPVIAGDGVGVRSVCQVPPCQLLALQPWPWQQALHTALARPPVDHLALRQGVNTLHSAAERFAAHLYPLLAE